MTSIELGRRGRLIYSGAGRAGQGPADFGLGLFLGGTRGRKVWGVQAGGRSGRQANCPANQNAVSKEIGTGMAIAKSRSQSKSTQIQSGSPLHPPTTPEIVQAGGNCGRKAKSEWAGTYCLDRSSGRQSCWGLSPRQCCSISWGVIVSLQAREEYSNLGPMR